MHEHASDLHARPPGIGAARPADEPLWRGRLRQRLGAPRRVRMAWALWGVFAVGITAAVLLAPERKRTNGAYRTAALAYLRSEPMYRPGSYGFLYPIQSAVVYIPFTFEPRILSEILWRLVGIGALASGVWRLARVGGVRGPPRTFLLMTLLTIPAALGSARNGQMNLHLAALFAHATVEVMCRRWGMAAVWLTFSIAAKPIAVAPVLLITAVYPSLWWRVALGLAVAAAAPFLHPHWAYVSEQYRAGLAKVIEAGEPGAGTFAELTSLLRLFMPEPGYAAMTAVRAGAAVATLAYSWWATRRMGRVGAAALVWTAGVSYLMVFNPRTEGNTYVILAPALALLGAWSVFGRWVRGRDALLVLACVVLAFAHVFFYKQHDLWLRPAVALATWVWLGVVAVAPSVRRTFPPPMGPEGDSPPAVSRS